jgi:glucose/arabinose dehydrogenase
MLAAPLAAEPTFTPVFGRAPFDRPVALVQDPVRRFYAVEQGGRIWRLDGDKRSVFADLRAQVRTDGQEEGLLSLAFHPGPKAAGRWYAIYSVQGAKPRKTRLIERREGSDGVRVLLDVEKRWSNHNGSTLAFGPDGFLYISLGDGGGAGDTLDAAQDLGKLLGKVLRIDVGRSERGRPYAIPKDNPFVGRFGARPEVWAYGLRNVWRMSFDPATGALWAGDVGQNAREELNVIERGGNYGWNWREGTQGFKKGGPARGAFVEPVLDYGRDLGVSITGGVVGGAGAPDWARGRYFFADFGSRRLWSLDAATRDPASLRQHGRTPQSPSSFGLDHAGRVYVVGYEGGIFRLD